MTFIKKLTKKVDKLHQTGYNGSAETKKEDSPC